MEDVRQRFAATLRSARDGLGLSQEDLAERVELSVEALGRLERGRVLPRAETLLRIADATGLSVDALLGRVAPVPGEDPYFGELLARTTQAERRFLVAVLRVARRESALRTNGVVPTTEPAATGSE